MAEYFIEGLQAQDQLVKAAFQNDGEYELIDDKRLLTFKRSKQVWQTMTKEEKDKLLEDFYKGPNIPPEEIVATNKDGVNLRLAAKLKFMGKKKGQERGKEKTTSQKGRKSGKKSKVSTSELKKCNTCAINIAFYQCSDCKEFICEECNPGEHEPHEKKICTVAYERHACHQNQRITDAVNELMDPMDKQKWKAIWAQTRDKKEFKSNKKFDDEMHRLFPSINEDIIEDINVKCQCGLQKRLAYYYCNICKKNMCCVCSVEEDHDTQHNDKEAVGYTRLHNILDDYIENYKYHFNSACEEFKNAPEELQNRVDKWLSDALKSKIQISMCKTSAKEVNEKAAAAKESSLDDDDSDSDSESESEPEISQPVLSQRGRKIIRNWNPKHGTPPSDFASVKSRKKKVNTTPVKKKLSKKAPVKQVSQKQKQKDGISHSKKAPVKSVSQKRKEKDDISPSKKKSRSKSPLKNFSCKRI